MFMVRVAEMAPYLSRLIELEPGLVESIRAKSPETLSEEILNAVRAYQVCDVEAELMAGLRAQKYKIHLLCALCDLAGVWPWEQVTRMLSDFADAALQVTLGYAARQAGLQTVPKGIFVLALGKYGGRELNYSSDIDIIFFYDRDLVRLDPDRGIERHMIRLVQRCARVIDTINGEGYVFRVDLRLRPDPRSNSVAISTFLAERYYEALGQNWERAAMIKARVCAGDEAAGQTFIDEVLSPYIWRKNLDFAAIDDISAMARQILSKGDRAKIKSADHNIKLGRGGIRSIEFFTQTQQLIHAGRRAQLRTARTDDTLDALAQAGVITDQTCIQMKNDYAFLRNIEHRIQMTEDEQDHVLPANDEKRSAIAWMSGYNDLADFDDAVYGTLERVHSAYDALYAGGRSLALSEGSLMFTGVAPERDTLRTLNTLGFTRGKDVWREMAGWLGGRIAATRTPRARELLTDLAPFIMTACRDSGQADEAFYRFSDFFTRLRSGVVLLSMFKAKPDTLTMLINLLAMAPRLARTLSDRPEVLDVLIEPMRGPRETGAITDTSLEEALSQLRLETGEVQFITGAGLLTGAVSPADAALAYTAQADRAVQTLLPLAFENAAQRLTPPGGLDFAVIALGKMGSREMSARSDLDLMVLYRPSTASDSAHQFAARMTKRLIRYLTSVTEDGPLYDVDMALRPSGGSGPITVSQAAFDSYYAKDAWTWEFMTLTRARVVAASSDGYASFLTARIVQVLKWAGSDKKICTDVRDMRARLWSEKPPKNDWHIKRVKGGRVDLEFITQGLSLIEAGKADRAIDGHVRAAIGDVHEAGDISDEQCTALIAAYDQFEALRQVFAVCLSGVFDPEADSAALKRTLCKVTGQPDFKALTLSYAKHRADVLKVFEELYGPY
ncbi:bifunctional [glutamine synthetase] adenylyltransferase/[glutamine synthetase]-adenylyl-L-tyrosine phosphorylase [Robiginitomaculum antarcticum]|uniref:bifunctional [glutamine synthetase] adenylyltransferase/[glutamine synthetase]-adenylyl-L-tyrosine phosphorylase n=1 Tax=Robiginitomaculum antarcticum TaxID=437507 RepID=UPI00035EF26C|nr:bifunctional [glutamine synthetase] adenylyltransferase/[glutamine synthetase]-adenylyl-L-tyrosine phosphorylase [Robiginitomaculum antarcticum]